MSFDRKNFLKEARKLSETFRVSNGSKFKLKNVDPGCTLHFRDDDKKQAKSALKQGVEVLSSLQDVLYAQDRWGVLLIFQAMDAAGKDGAIKHVMSGVNPQGCQVSSFKAPSAVDLDHDYLWRSSQHLPQRGNIGIFNRSYYEETLVVRVHPELLEKQKIPPSLITPKLWNNRFEDIRNFERYLTRNGIVVRKFFLYLSKEEQKRRFLERIDKPEKNWKFSPSDAEEREHWDEYMKAYEDMICHTATKEAPWFVVPADNKWFTRLVVSATVIDTLSNLDLHFPKVNEEQKAALEATKTQLLAEEKK